MDLTEIRADLAAFADNEEDVQIDRSYVLFQRDRVSVSFQLRTIGETLYVELPDQKMPYRRFLAEHLGRMSTLASALIEKRKDVDPYIDTQATFIDSFNTETSHSSALDLLKEESSVKTAGETKLIFLTADAGHGKTALLKRMTRQHASAYLQGRSDNLLFHIDTQGRSFVRLEEAIARDLGQLRIFGLFYPGVLRLVRRGLLTLAIDGFDELLAEIGTSEAYSGLGSLLRTLKGDGTIIASARSAYFEIENYAAQTRLLTSSPDAQVSVSQLRLDRWQRTQSVSFFSQYKDENGDRIEYPEPLYDRLSSLLTPDHPVLHRPFLVYRLALLLAPNNALVDEIAADIGTPGLRVVPHVINALLKREVQEKWRDPNGQPYLTVEEHIALLSAIADEMWSQGKNALSVEMVQLIAESVLDNLGTPVSSRVQIIQRVKAHALLPLANGELSFDHDEFLNYFLATGLLKAILNREKYAIVSFCEAFPLPQSVALWAGNLYSWEPEEGRDIINWLGSISRDDIRSSYLKQNIGSISGNIAIAMGNAATNLEFLSMFFEGPCLKGVHLADSSFVNCTWLNADCTSATFKNCTFSGCQIDGLVINHDSSFAESFFTVNNSVVGVLWRRDIDDPQMKNYVPEECRAILSELGADFEAQPEVIRMELPPVPPTTRKALESFLKIFAKNSGVNEGVVRTKLGARFNHFERTILPLLLKHGVVKAAVYSGGGQQARWELACATESLLKAEDPSSSTPRELRDFWSALRDL